MLLLRRNHQSSVESRVVLIMHQGKVRKMSFHQANGKLGREEGNGKIFTSLPSPN